MLSQLEVSEPTEKTTCLFPDELFEMSPEVLIDAQKVSVEAKDGKWRFLQTEVDADLRDSVSTLTADSYLTQEDLRKLPHNLVCNALSGNLLSDVPLSTIEKTDTKADLLTPDMILRQTWGFLVLEVKTTKGADPFIPMLRVKQKYLHPLSLLSCKTRLATVIVSHAKLWTDLPITNYQASKLVSLYNYGIELQALAEECGFVRDAETTSIERVRGIFCSIPFKSIGESPYTIKEADIDSWRSYSDCDSKGHFIDTVNGMKMTAKAEEPEFLGGVMHVGTIVKFPFFSGTEVDTPAQDFSGPMNRVWSQSVSKNPEVFHDVKQSNVINKRERFRVMTSLEQDDQLVLAMRGVEAKRFKNLPEAKYQKDKLSNGISESTSDSQVEGLMELWRDLTTRGPSQDPLHEFCLNDEDFAQESSYLSGLISSPLGQCLKNITTVAMELNYSRRQNCKRGEFILKKLPFCWILIKPTSANKHLYYSIYVRDYKEVPCFLKLSPHGGGFITDFYSVQPGKLQNLINCLTMFPVIQSTMNNLFNGSIILQGKRSNDHSCLCLLMHLENKLLTSADSLLTRFIYMETLVPKPNLWKVWPKFSKVIRHPLQLFFRKRIRMATRLMVEINSKEVSPSMISWVDLKPFDNFEQCLNLMYFGSTYNKDQGDELHGFMKIFKKVVSEEKKLDEESKSRMGSACGTGPHEFCPSTLKDMGQCVREQLGRTGKADFWRSCYQELSDLGWSYFSTMKASAEKPPSDNLNMLAAEQLLTGGPIPNYRIKCASAVNKLRSKFPKDFWSSVSTLLEECENQELNVVNLFRKAQHGGDREIFVLTMHFRVLIHILERIMRTVADALPGEMLTKPTEKASVSASHFGKISELTGNGSLATAITSADAATWCQQFMMSQFAIVLDQFVPEEMKGFIFRVLNLMTNKKLMLPIRLLEVIQKHPDVDSQNPELDLIRDGYLHGNSLIKQGSVYLRNWSNMMQGIAHYTSTVYHWAYRELSAKYTRMVMPAVSKKLNVSEIKVFIAKKQSSDDSSRILTLHTEQENVDDLLCKLANFFEHVDSEFFRFAGCRTSYEKSTIGVVKAPIEEFNSKWYIGANTLSIILKFAVRCLEVSSFGSLTDRLNAYSNIRSQLLSEGANFKLVSAVQQMQCIQHYINLGLFNVKDRAFFLEVHNSSHPRFGRFVLEPSLTTGLFGHSFAMYHIIAQNPNSFISRHEAWICKNTLIEAEEAATDVSLKFSYGDGKRFKKFLQSGQISLDQIRAELNDDPMKLFSPEEEDIDDVRIKLSLLSPSLPNHFKTPDLPNMAATSVYIWDYPVFLNEGRKVALQHMRQEAQETEEPISMDFRFPLHEVYHQVSALISREYKFTGKKPCKKRYVTALFRSETVQISLERALSILWFGKQTDYEKVVIEDSLNHYRRLHPWIRDSMQDTITHLKLKSPLELKFLLSSVSEAKRKISIITSSRKSSSPCQTLFSIISQNQSELHDLDFERKFLDLDEEWQLNTGEESLFSQCLQMAASGPNPSSDVKRFYIRNANYTPDVCIKFMSKANYTYVKLLHHMIFKSHLGMHDILRMKGGFLSGFTKRQHYDRKTGEYMGEGRLLMDFGRDEQVELHLKDRCLTKLVCTGPKTLMQHHRAIRSMVEELRLVPLVNNTLRDDSAWTLREYQCMNGTAVRYGTLTKLNGCETRCVFKNDAILLQTEVRGTFVTLVRSTFYYDFMEITTNTAKVNFDNEFSECWFYNRAAGVREIRACVDRDWLRSFIRRRCALKYLALIDSSFKEMKIPTITLEPKVAEISHLDDLFNDSDIETLFTDAESEFEDNFMTFDLDLSELDDFEHKVIVKVNRSWDLNTCVDDYLEKLHDLCAALIRKGKRETLLKMLHQLRLTDDEYKPILDLWFELFPSGFC